jgi:hypothetical protein
MENDNKITWDRFLQALTQEDKAFNFPIKYPAVEIDRNTRNTLLLTAGILAGGFVLTAFIISNAKKRR